MALTHKEIKDTRKKCFKMKILQSMQLNKFHWPVLGAGQGRLEDKKGMVCSWPSLLFPFCLLWVYFVFVFVFSDFLRWKPRFETFLIWAFPSKYWPWLHPTNFDVLSHCSKYFRISLMISSLTHGLFRIVLFSFQIFEYFFFVIDF